MLYNNNSQGADFRMRQKGAAHDAAAVLRTEVWGQVRDAFEVRRRDEGLTQAELARRIGLQRERVHYWMSRPERMTLDAAARLMAGLNGRLECFGRLEPAPVMTEDAP